MKITAVLEGPISSDGRKYYHAKGERLYLDSIAQYVEQLNLVTYVFRPEHEGYASAAQSAFESSNVRVVELPFEPERNYSPIQKLGHFLDVFKTIWRNSRDTDLYYFFVPSYPAAMAWLMNKVRRKPYIVYAACDWEAISRNLFRWQSTRYEAIYPLFVRMNGLLEKWMAKKALFCVTAGRALFDKYQRFNANVHETTPRITLGRKDIFYRADTCNGDQIVLISVGDLIPRKNLELLIHAVAKLRQRCERPVRLMLVGVGPLEAGLRELSRNLGLEDEVAFTGYVKEEKDLYALYREADIYVLTSRAEGFPRVLYEAMSQSLPIITTNCGGVTGLIVNRKNGIVIDVDDGDGLVDALDSMVSDIELRRSLIKNARNTVTGILERSDPIQIPKLIRQYLPDLDS